MEGCPITEFDYYPEQIFKILPSLKTVDYRDEMGNNYSESEEENSIDSEEEIELENNLSLERQSSYSELLISLPDSEESLNENLHNIFDEKENNELKANFPIDFLDEERSFNTYEGIFDIMY